MDNAITLDCLPPRATVRGDCRSERGRNSPDLKAQVNILREKNWSTPDCSDRRSKISKQQGLCNEVQNWATPNTLDHLPPRTAEGVEKQATCAKKGRRMPANLREQVDKKSCEIYRNNWRTPAACEGEGGVKTLLSIQGDPQPKIKLRDHVNDEI